MTCRRRSLPLASLALVLRQCRRRQEENRKQKRRFSVRKIFTEERKDQGEWENLFRELSNDDREYYYGYLRMSLELFEHLFNLVGPLIAKQDTNYRKSKSIPAKKHHVITLRYLAEVSSQQALSLGF